MSDDYAIRNLTGTRFERILMTVEQQLRLALDQARQTTSHAGDDQHGEELHGVSVAPGTETVPRITRRQDQSCGLSAGAIVSSRHTVTHLMARSRNNGVSRGTGMTV
jgi:hypothetical protein